MSSHMYPENPGFGFCIFGHVLFRGLVTKTEIVSNPLCLVFNFPCIIVCRSASCFLLLSGAFHRVLNRVNFDLYIKCVH